MRFECDDETSIYPVYKLRDSIIQIDIEPCYSQVHLWMKLGDERGKVFWLSEEDARNMAHALLRVADIISTEK